MLGIDGERITVNGQPTFLLGISYYGALAAPEEFIKQDFAEFAVAGINWVRVWAMWGFFDQNLAATDLDGQPRQPYFDHLLRICELAAAENLIVDVTLIHSGERSGQPAMLRDVAAHIQAVRTLTTALKPHRNVYVDLANERDLKNKWVSFEDLRRMRDALKAIDPDRLVTASSTGEPDDEEFIGSIRTAGLDFLTPHVPRSSASAARNKDRTTAIRQRLKELDLVVPLHYQEPFRRGFTKGWEPSLEDFLNDLRGAVDGGAAGWCFHNGDQRDQPDGRPRRSFDLRRPEGRLIDQLDEVETSLMEALHQQFGH